jgi:NAD(P)-dependent dehydrogenase (short-subunit alcohol dehydrogenase family)
MNFEGKVALVTGSTTGIGEACARVFAESGAAVMVSGRDAARGLAVAAEIRGAGGTRGIQRGGLACAGCLRRLVAATVAALGA